LGVLPRHVSVF